MCWRACWKAGGRGNGAILPDLPLQPFSHEAERTILETLQQWKNQAAAQQHQAALAKAEELMFGEKNQEEDGTHG